MIIFLDFDGVTHTIQSSELGYFQHVPALEEVLREFPSVQIVISSSVKKEQTNQTQMTNAMEASAKSQGFLTAGVWFFSLAKKNTALLEATSQNIKVANQAKPPNDTTFVGVDSIYAKAYIANAAADEKTQEPVGSENWVVNKIKGSICNTGSNGISLGRCIVDMAINSNYADQNALIRIGELGDNIALIGGIGVEGIGAAEGAIDGADKTIIAEGANLVGIGIVKNAAKGALTTWLKIMQNAFSMLFYFGIMCAVYIPLIPAIVWIMRIVSIIALWVEAVISSSVWAFAHLETSGEGMGDRSGHGYMFLFATLLNPMLSVLGLICGIVALDVMSTFVLMVYPDVIANAAGDNFTGIIKIIGFIIVYVMINLSLVNVCMQLINVVPDNIMDWIGGRISGSLGKGGEDMVGGAAKSSLAGSSWMPNKMPKNGGGGKPTVDGAAGTITPVTHPK